MAILLAEYNVGDVAESGINTCLDGGTASSYIKTIPTPGYVTYITLKIRAQAYAGHELSGNLNIIFTNNDDYSYGSIPLISIGETPSLIAVAVLPTFYLESWDWARLLPCVDSEDGFVMWRSGVSQSTYIWQIWGETTNPDLPGKPINPTPIDNGTGIILGLAELTWESGS